MNKRELVNTIIETLKLPNYLDTAMLVEQKLNEVIKECGGNTKEMY